MLRTAPTIQQVEWCRKACELVGRRGGYEARAWYTFTETCIEARAGRGCKCGGARQQ